MEETLLKRVETAEQLAEQLQEYAFEVSEGERTNEHDNHIVDDLLIMREHLKNDGVIEGAAFQEYFLKCDSMIQLYDTVQLTRFLSCDLVTVKIMEIKGVLVSDGKLYITFLGEIIAEQ